MAYLLYPKENTNYIFRDHYSREIKPIHKDLIDLFHTISKTIGDGAQFHIIPQASSSKQESAKPRLRFALCLRFDII